MIDVYVLVCNFWFFFLKDNIVFIGSIVLVFYLDIVKLNDWIIKKIKEWKSVYMIFFRIILLV